MEYNIKNMLPDGSCSIYLYGEVCDEGGEGRVSSREIVEHLAWCESEGVQNVTLRINSIGGDVYPGIAIFNAIRRSKCNITAAIDGVAASIAGIIALAAPRIEMGKYARLMIHNVSGGGYGNKTELMALINQITSLEEDIAAIIAARAGVEVAYIQEHYFDDGKDHWLSAQDAINMRLADAIYDEDPVDENADGTELYNIFTNRLQHSLQQKSNTKMFENLKKNPRFANVASEEEVEAVVAAMESEAATKDEELTAVKAELDALKAQTAAEQAARIEADVEAAVKDGRIDDDQRELYTNLLNSDYANGSKALSMLKPKNMVSQFINHGDPQPQNALTPWEKARQAREARRNSAR